ncbi:MmcQ/YjbR family DNA-binding protein [Spelaeicoccus albus]|uniref:MmcQ/YjbR family DNA-binding protein n=1 Tax=Spelaeicoccus albus TaxID=1280376 RepID=A0A7Z0AA49_9MICO|nr:MmcQ/YjbR family DNA-binding protein [Spelaeicoccus albus]NYI66360.1 hypothetical protein [Spelaeicoccus albus]
MDWSDVVRIGLSLPETAESTSYGTPALKVAGKLLARLRNQDGGAVLCCGLDEKAALLADDDPAFYTTAHYDGYGAILVRLEHTDSERLRELLVESWLANAPAKVRNQHIEELA